MSRIKKSVSCFLCLLVFVAFASSSMAEKAAIPVVVNLHKGTILNMKEASKRVSVSNPEIADFNLISPTEILINGKKVGVTTLITWDKLGNTRFFDVRVTADIRLLEEQIRNIAPEDDIHAELANDTIVLSGHAGNRETISKVVQIAQAYAVASEVTTETKYSAGLTTTETKSEGKVINHIIVQEAQQILLEVKVAQVNKTKLKELGIGFIVQGIKGNQGEGAFTGFNFNPGGTLGALDITETQELGLGPSGETVVTDRYLGESNLWPGITGFDFVTNTPQIGYANFPAGVAVMLRALSQKGYAKILAEPNLIVMSGESGEFHVGTRFPVQVVQGTGAAATTSIQYEEIGIKLNFTADVLETHSIRLRIDPAEVSNIQDIVRLQNLIAPVVDARTVKTIVDLKDGESIILAGLLSDETKKNIQKVPILGDIPIFGALFRSTSDELNQTELVFFITPKLVKPTPPGVTTALPTDKPLTPKEEAELRWIPFPRSDEPSVEMKEAE